MFNREPVTFMRPGSGARPVSRLRDRLIHFGAALAVTLMLSPPAPGATPGPTWGGANTDRLDEIIDGQISFQTAITYWNGTPPTFNELYPAVMIRLFVNGNRLPLSPHSMKHTRTVAAAPSASATSDSYTLASSTPVIPFVGNKLVVLGTALFANNSNVSAVGLERESDCSISEDILEPVNDRLTPTSVTTLPAAQDYIHQLSGLTTTADVFPNGCTDSPLGKTASYSVESIGTSNNIAMAAILTGTGLLVREINATTHADSTITLATGSSIFAFTVADLNGDGLNDVVASGVTDPATQKASFAVFLNNGDGTFRASTYVDAQGTIEFTVDDMNADGKPDIVFDHPQFDQSGTPTSDEVVTLLGNGDGTFAAGVSTSISVGGHGSAFVTGDFNSDGKKDLLFGSLVLLGVGDGTFTAGPVLPGTSISGTQYEIGVALAAAVGDFNKDGKLDIAYSMTPGGGASVVQVLLGNGNGAFLPGARYASLTPAQQLTVTDIDGDGNPDIVVGSSSLGLYAQDSDDPLGPMFQILPGRGDGTFVGAPVYTQNSTPVATGDFTGDGKNDLLVFGTASNGLGGSINQVLTLPGDGTGSLAIPVTSSINVNPSLLAVADMNKDGKLDAVIAGRASSSAPQLSVVISQGNGTFAGEHDYPLPEGAVSLVTGDFNGDGFMDVAVGVAPIPGNTGVTGVYVLLGQANGTLASPVKIDASLDPTSLAAADFNGDGRTDLVVADQGFLNYVGSPRQINGALQVYLGNADGTFTATVAPTTSATNYSLVALGDLNGDGKLDLIVGGNVAGASVGAGTPNLYTLLGNGDGTFQAAQTTTLIGADGLGAQSIALADFNHDGKLDVVVGNPNDFTEVLLGLGDGTFAHALLALGQQPTTLGAVDLNGDGMSELLMGSTSGLAVFMNVATWPSLASTAATTTTLNVSPNPVAPGQSVTLAATVTSTTSGTPTGTVSFVDGSTSLGSAALSAQGSATFSTTSLAAGTHSLTAQYSGDGTFAASTASAVTLTVDAAAPDFSVGANPASGTAAAGQSVTTTITVTPAGGFSGAVTLACSGLPTGASCSFSSSSVTLSGAPATSTLTISSTPRMALDSSRGAQYPWMPGGVVLAGIGLPVAVRGRRVAMRARRFSLFALLLIGAVLLHGCGGGGGGASSGSSGGTPAGSYTITVTATAGSTSHALSYVLTVS